MMNNNIDLYYHSTVGTITRYSPNHALNVFSSVTQAHGAYIELYDYGEKTHLVTTDQSAILYSAACVAATNDDDSLKVHHASVDDQHHLITENA
ncbi:hypothetical protein E2P81_ATG03024 [Venturia nashicola]|uniref:Uncharacterized protein n=1 Tax=Venturia nashicola TaxID=86259 RepID=A0A4Z1PLR2_9PEZI|nr:hypothetical protein E6O75_ATG03088 [Venturia nashicola]TLD36135.1 hypothetical protein E2P81_ATG03024 [Venturia nashicola]